MLIEDPWSRLRDLTDARIALGRAGHSLPTREWLAFQLAHAKARDAVTRPLDLNLFRSLNPIVVQSAAPDRSSYLRRPDLGRKLALESAALLKYRDTDAAIIIADGLSAVAVERYAVAMIGNIKAELTDWSFAPICLVQQGRVAIADEIGERIGARMAVILIGERPGLSCPESMGVYLTWDPRVGRTDAERNCISNIRFNGLTVDLAAQKTAQLMRAAKERRLTGVGLRLLSQGAITSCADCGG